MNNKINVKVCGMTRETDIEQVLSLGADYLGFIVYPKSSRALKLERAAELSAIVPSGKRVLVDVGTDPVDLERYKRAGFDHFQIHVNSSPERQILVEYVNIVGRDHLWLAPRLAPADSFPEWILEYTKTIVFDTYSKDQIGGTGRTGDFAHFAELKERFADTEWVLAGGLSSANIVNAVKESNALAIDVNSGVEKAPGVKDPEKLREFFQVALNIEH
ncbi:MAG: phosphoribosylanthranilate isomerase [Lentimonas sp.]|jgi:phosphoribosylanthranilate isomerase